MNRDDIIRMAREAHGELLASGKGMYVWHGDAYAGDVQDFCEHFAALVAAAEREACAVMAEAFHHHQYDFTGDLELHEAIRARGEK